MLLLSSNLVGPHLHEHLHGEPKGVAEDEGSPEEAAFPYWLHLARGVPTISDSTFLVIEIILETREN